MAGCPVCKLCVGSHGCTQLLVAGVGRTLEMINSDIVVTVVLLVICVLFGASLNTIIVSTYDADDPVWCRVRAVAPPHL